MNEKERLFIIIPMSDKAVANELAKGLDRNLEDNGADTFGSVRLSANGEEPATHTGCSTAADAEYLRDILGARAGLPSAGGYRASDGWTWGTALADMGLQTINLIR